MRYSLSTCVRPGGSMITAPNMPFAMCNDMGAVAQWYIHTPDLVAVKS